MNGLSGIRSVQAVGECMLEVVRTGPEARIDFAGDTYNTAVYLKRVASDLGIPDLDVRYLSGIGDDEESKQFRARLAREDLIDDSQVVPGAGLGRYLVRTDDRGERSFTYWRTDSASAMLFAGEQWIERVGGDLVYLSGITAQLMSPAAHERLITWLSELRRAGSTVVVDTNYRAAGWPSVRHARTALDALLGVTDIALVTYDDERGRTGCTSVAECAQRLRALGVVELVIKVGAQGAWAGIDELALVPTDAVKATDTTAAGDSFNAAYLAARIAGADPVEAARRGNQLAGVVVTRPGAVIAREAMPAFLRA